MKRVLLVVTWSIQTAVSLAIHDHNTLPIVISLVGWPKLIVASIFLNASAVTLRHPTCLLRHICGHGRCITKCAVVSVVPLLTCGALHTQVSEAG